MKAEYDLSKMKSRRNPFASKLKKPVTMCFCREAVLEDGENGMHNLKWSESEKKIARRVFEAALQQELGEVMSKFKERAARAEKPDDMWAIEGWLAHRRRDIDTKYDFRYSQLVIVFGKLLRESRITEQQLEGLGEDKLSYIQGIAAL